MAPKSGLAADNWWQLI